jgi:signal transduction histidine kinase
MRRFWLPAATMLIVLALGALAHVQWQWIGALSRLDEEHERRVLDFAATQFAAEFDHDVASIISGTERMRPENMFHFARDPRLIAGIFVAHDGDLDRIAADGSHQPIDWPPVLAPVRSMLQGPPMRGRSPIEPTVPAIVLMLGRRMPGMAPPPLFEPRPPLLIIQLDRAYMVQHLFPDLAHRLGKDFDVAVSDGQHLVYRSNPAWSGEKAEVVVPLLHDSGWRLSIRNHYGAVAELVARSRRRNITGIAHVMLILILSLALLALMARRAERQREQQLEFVAGLTHELNTPLAALQAAGENLADGVVHDDAQVARYGSMVAKEARRLGDLVAQVLDYSGLRSRKAIIRVPVGIAGVIANAVDAAHWIAEENKVEVHASVADDLPPVNGDAETLTRAVQNLIVNAIRHGGEGGWVGVTAARVGEKVAITVEDRGPGISSRDAAHLFEPFYRGRNATSRGTGLGLTIVSQIARAHGGSIAFDCHRTSGAAFTLTLPAVKRG